MEDCSERRKKRKKRNNSPKLLAGHKVEVRSVDEGSMGSWHSAVVISRNKNSRDVRYDFLFCDDGSEKLIEKINVHPVVDGIIPIGRMRIFYRGLIRPVPPPLAIERLSVHYGQCVDAYYQEAWWEGVVFDHENNCEFYYIFFPDIGDLMQIGVDNLRITQDWDEFTEKWMPRGNWLFLELVEEFKKEKLVHVSAREIWYEVSEKEGFEKIKEWTNFSTKREVWGSLVMEVINDHSELVAEMFFKEVNEIVLQSENDPLVKLNAEEKGRVSNISLSSSSTNGSGSCISDKPIKIKNVDECQIGGHGIDMSFAAEKCLEIACKSKINEEKGLYMISSSNSDTTDEETPCSAPSILPCNMLQDLEIVSEESPNDKRNKRKWEIAGTDIVPEAEFCPGSVSKYLSGSKSENHMSLTLSLRKHLAYLGWKIEFSRDVGLNRNRMRYTSPKGRSYMSLVTVCKDWKFSQNKTTQWKEAKLCSPPPTSHALISSPSDIVEPAEFPDAVKYYARFVNLREQTKKKILPKNVTPMDMENKAKKHLVSCGWSIWTDEAEKKDQIRYTSPYGETYSSLVIACKAYTYGELNDGGETSLYTEPMKYKNISNEANEKIIANGGSLSLTRCNSLFQRRGKKTAYKKNEKKQLPLAKVRDDMDDDYSPNCSKRPARQLDSSSSFGTPLTVLSWLTDNDVVLPRSKVYYLGRNPIKEGIITREGIKCNCCKINFSLGKFEAHAGSSHENNPPAANIYLDDGRSLLSCQLQLRNRLRIKNTLTPSCQPKRKSTNDSICSVCRFGGLLVMCDHCPSSFHRECLGLKDIPDGEWFCPQCCCGICGNNKFNLGAKQIMQGSILNCHQCERRYHVGCLLKQCDANMKICSEGKWFCNRKCEQIFLGLRKLLDKPFVVGDGNLTWTLLKYIPRDGNMDDMAPSVETYSKLNLVVSVMRECFEPMNEPGTKTDIVEDVIFSKGSNLSRLNFEGFYNVLLSKDDELITVAAVRVHGEKVAEVPLVGTRFKYRKLGMCRFLMNELEKKLMELGVERMIMPSAPSVLNTWTASFGFSKLNETERLNLRSYTFLDFQGAVMCQKILMSAQPIRTLQKTYEGVGGLNDETSYKQRKSSELFQAERTKEAKTVYQGTEYGAAGNCTDSSNRQLPLVLRVDQQTSEKKNQAMVLSEEANVSEESDNMKRDGFLKCYKRRRIITVC